MESTSDGDSDTLQTQQASLPATSTELTANIQEESLSAINSNVSLDNNNPNVVSSRIHKLKQVLRKVPEVLNKLVSEKSRAEQTVNDFKIETPTLRKELDQVKSFIESMNANKNVVVHDPNMLVNQDISLIINRT